MDPFESLLERTTQERTHLEKELPKRPLLMFMIGQKASGKGTRVKLLQKALPGHFEHVAVGDMARALQERLQEEEIEKVAEDLAEYLPKDLTQKEIIELLEPFIELEGSKLKSTEVILALVRQALNEAPEKSIILDGFPRSPEQIEHAIELIDEFEAEGYYPLFVNVETPEEVRDIRMRYRRVCPECQNSKNLKLWPTDIAEYDPQTDEIYLVCDNETCERVRMVEKDYDAEGAAVMKDRDQITQDMVDHLHHHHPDHIVSISNAIPTHLADRYEPHDLTEVTHFTWDPEMGKVVKTTEPWTIQDTTGTPAYSGNPEPWILDFLKELRKRYS